MSSEEPIPAPVPTPTAQDVGARRLPGLAVAGLASIGAGAIHGAATGIHAEHPALARLFVIATVAQLGAGLWALLRPSLVATWTVLAVNVAAVGGWLVTRTRGVSWISGLETREAPQFTDTVCAALGCVAIGGALGALMVHHAARRHTSGAARLLIPAVAVAALAIPGMWVGGTHVHSHDGAETAAGHSHAPGEEHTTSASPDAGVAAPATAGSTAELAPAHNDGTAHHHPDTTPTTHSHGSVATSPTANWPRPWDPTKPLDLSGVPGVSAEQERRAATLVEESLVELPRWSETSAAVADGYRSIGDAATGSEHYIKTALINDDAFLDPTKPESLVYTVDGDKRTLAGAMFIASARPTDDPTLTDFAGPLMTWHNHGNLCWAIIDGTPKVVGITDANGACSTGVNTGGDNPMVHVWITSHQCGVFAALEGVGAGQTAVSEAERTDMCGQHDHGGAPAPAPAGGTPGTNPSTDGATPAGSAAPAASSLAYDPALPIDLSGTAGVTAAQQAAAENIVSENLRRLPHWADYRVAEAAGYRSIGDGRTGAEHFIKWDSINDDVWLDPDHPESLVYEPQPDGSKKLVSAMYMLPDTVSLDNVPDIGGPLMQWHIHDNLCFTDSPDQAVVAGLTNAAGECPAPLIKFRPAPMIHVWIVKHACGPFAALEGIAAGQVKAGEEHLCDHVHGSTGLLG